MPLLSRLLTAVAAAYPCYLAWRWWAAARAQRRTVAEAEALCAAALASDTPPTTRVERLLAAWRLLHTRVRLGYDATRLVPFPQLFISSSRRRLGPVRFTVAVELGIAFNAAADAPNALRFYEAALQQAERLRDPGRQALVHCNTGNVHNNTTGDYAAAVQCYETALGLHKRGHNLQEAALVHANLGLAHLSLQVVWRATGSGASADGRAGWAQGN